MILFKTSGQLKNHLLAVREKEPVVGFVPTMGALHEGHLSMIHKSKQITDLTICSIFVNPTQFNNKSDFEKYPSSIPDDILELQQAGCDMLFLPSVNEIYPGGTSNLSHYELGYLETILEGQFRPGHFQGVCNVVDRLLDSVMPDRLFLGQKDFQQVMVIDKLLSLRVNENPQLEIVPTLRENDGLAMSSRNRRLNEDQRKKAPALYHELNSLSSQLKPGDITALKRNAQKNLEQKGFRIDYIEVADSLDLKTVDTWDGNCSLVILVAAFLDDIRLIDNIIFNP